MLSMARENRKSAYLLRPVSFYGDRPTVGTRFFPIRSKVTRYTYHLRTVHEAESSVRMVRDAHTMYEYR